MEEKQSNHLAEQREHREGLHQNLEEQHGPEGGDGRTPTERLRGSGVQRLMYELGEKVLFLPHAPARRGDFGARFDNGINLGCRSFDGQAYLGTPSEVTRCRTLRQLSAEKKWDTEFVLNKGTPWSSDGKCAGGVNIRVDLPEARGDRGADPPDIDPPITSWRKRFTGEMFERFGLP